MAVKVKTAYMSAFNMPGVCAGCGGAPGAGKLKVGREQSSGFSGKHRTTLNLEFPLCDTCGELNARKFGGVPKTIAIAGILLTILGCVLPMLVGNSEIGWVYGILIGAFLLVTTGILTSALHKNMDYTPQEREQLKKIRRSVKLVSFQQPGLLINKTGSIVFSFEDPAYAGLFSQVNAGEILGRPK